jgi:microsomal dipeptidase-like Zn-dependent dipeptidase
MRAVEFITESDKIGEEHMTVANAIIRRLTRLKNNGFEKLHKQHGIDNIVTAINSVVKKVGPKDIILSKDVDQWTSNVLKLVKEFEPV